MMVEKGLMKKSVRRIKHLYKSGCIFRGIEHFLVMFPSAIIIASLTNTTYGEPVFNLSSILLAVGISTLIFIKLTKGKIPFFLGPSFSYIGFTSYYVATISCRQDIQYIRATILWGYLLSSILLICLSSLYRYNLTKKIINFLFPSVVMGPAISLIGLELANTAINDAGLTGVNFKVKMLAIFTLIIIIFASLTKRKILKNTSVFIGILCGCILASTMGMYKFDLPYKNIFIFPTLYINSFLILPNNIINLFISILPSTIMNFTELIGRVTVLEGMQKRDNITNDNLMLLSLKRHSLSNLISISTTSVPTTFYAENLAIMNLNNSAFSQKGVKMSEEDMVIRNCYNSYCSYPYIIASILSILVACNGCLQDLFMGIPRAVLGAMELFIFTLVASPGIQLLVDSKVDYKKISNQIISASILLAGVSSLIIEYKTIYLKGMSLGLTIGVVLNLLTRVFAYFGILNENLTLLEILQACIECYDSKINLFVSGNIFFSDKEMSYSGDELISKINKKDIYNMLQMSDKIELKGNLTNKKIIINQAYDQILLNVSFPIELQQKYTNDYNFIVPLDENGKVQIVINSAISIHKLNELLKNIV